MILLAVIACGLVSIVYAIWATQSVLAADQGNERMQEIAGAIQAGALVLSTDTLGVIGSWTCSTCGSMRRSHLLTRHDSVGPKLTRATDPL